MQKTIMCVTILCFLSSFVLSEDLDVKSLRSSTRKDFGLDQFKECDVIRHKLSPSQIESTDFQLYYRERNGTPISPLYLRIARLDSEDLFTKKYSFKTDKNTYELNNLPLTQQEKNAQFGRLSRLEQRRALEISGRKKAGVALTEDDIRFMESKRLASEFTDGYRTKKGQTLTRLKDFKKNNRTERKRFRETRAWECYDEPVLKSQEKMIEDIATSKNVEIKYVGSKYYLDLDVNPSVRSRMLVVLKLFKASGGELSK